MFKVRCLRRSMPAAFKGLRGYDACGVMMPAAFNCLRRSIACGVKRAEAFNCLRRSMPAAFNACGVQRLAAL